ncbi:MAG: hypothetical protein AB1763_06720 [Campylobacterota bacterium]
MRGLWMMAIVFAAGWGAESVLHNPPPHQPEAQKGKEHYTPLPDTLKVDEEMRIQQENAIPGGRGDGMHSYGMPAGEKSETETRP